MINFIIQDGVFSDEQEELIQILNDRKIPYELNMPYSIIANGNYVVRGSTEFITGFDRMFGEYCHIIPLNLKTYTYSKYVRSVRALNQDYILLPYHKLYDDFTCNHVVNLFEGERIFMRPNSGRKIFAGTTLYKRTWLKELDIIRSIPNTSIKDNTMVVLSSYKKLDAEFRIFIHNKRIVTYSQYEGYYDEINFSTCLDEISYLIRNLKTTCVDVVDVGLFNRKFYIIERNSPMSSGWYDMDYHKIIDCLENFFKE